MRFLYLLFFILLFACGTRKTTYSKKEIKSDTFSVNNSVVLKQNYVLNDIYQLRPFDPTKPIIIDGKEYFNVSIIYDKSKFNNFEIEKSNKLNRGSLFQKEKSKETEKTDYTILVLGMFFILLLFIFLWFYLKKWLYLL